jgi:hypothetical protein
MSPDYTPATVENKWTSSLSVTLYGRLLTKMRVTPLAWAFRPK